MADSVLNEGSVGLLLSVSQRLEGADSEDGRTHCTFYELDMDVTGQEAKRDAKMLRALAMDIRRLADAARGVHPEGETIKVLVDALENPPEPSAALKAAWLDYEVWERQPDGSLRKWSDNEVRERSERPQAVPRVHTPAPTERPIVWLLDRGDGIRRVELHEMEQRDGTALYAVRQTGFTLNTDWEWEYEPQPSSRDDDYIARNRYPTFDAAVAAFRRTSAQQHHVSEDR